MAEQITVRFVKPEDHAFILRINQENVEVLAPMDAERLHYFVKMAERFFVAEINGEPAAFLIALREGITSYDSENYRWFSGKYDKFLYVDRIVIDRPYRRTGLGRLLYRAVFERAEATAVPVVTAEIDTKPYNGGSLLFHREMGFSEVGTQSVRGGSVEVSLQAAEIVSNQEKQNEKS